MSWLSFSKKMMIASSRLHAYLRSSTTCLWWCEKRCPGPKWHPSNAISIESRSYSNRRSLPIRPSCPIRRCLRPNCRISEPGSSISVCCWCFELVFFSFFFSACPSTNEPWNSDQWRKCGLQSASLHRTSEENERNDSQRDNRRQTV